MKKHNYPTIPSHQLSTVSGGADIRDSRRRRYSTGAYDATSSAIGRAEASDTDGIARTFGKTMYNGFGMAVAGLAGAGGFAFGLVNDVADDLIGGNDNPNHWGK